ncbi:MAG: hypothetical protein K6E38_02275 [Fretibacterium sp.]|nr:hypothetical protein [Fretibacterium sp.]
MRRFFLLLILFLVCTSAFAADPNLSDVFLLSGGTEIRAEDDSVESMITPFIDITRQQGSSRLSGRYAHLKAIPSRAGGENILAPTSIVMEIGQDGSGSMNIAGGDSTRIQVSLDVQANIPTLTTAYADDPSEAPMTDFAVMVPQGNRYIWRLVSSQSGNLRLLYPLTADWFPTGYLDGTWQGDDGSSLTFQNGQLSFNGQTVGTYTLSDNRVSVTMSNGGSDLLFTACDPDSGLLVITFNGMDPNHWNAMTYRRNGQQVPQQPQQPQYPQQPQQPQYPQQPQQPQYPQQPQQPQYPQQPFPPFPQQQISLNGVWGTVLPNGVQAVIQIQGNQYWGWINGLPSESGFFQIQGNVMQGQTSTGTTFITQFQCDGRILSMRFQDGSTITYQRMQ